MSANGSSATGHCSFGSTTNGRSICFTAESSVLLDGIVPSLVAGLNHDTWASDLLVFNTSNTVLMEFNFSARRRMMEVEVILFNCKDWGIEVQVIRLLTSELLLLGVLDTSTITSCRFLTTFCLRIPETYLHSVTLQFVPGPAHKVILAEIKLLTIDDGSCDPTTTTLDPTATFPTDPPLTSACTLLLLIFLLLAACHIAIIVVLALWHCYEAQKKDQLRAN